jgi:hypothetical protein
MRRIPALDPDGLTSAVRVDFHWPQPATPQKRKADVTSVGNPGGATAEAAAVTNKSDHTPELAAIRGGDISCPRWR